MRLTVQSGGAQPCLRRSDARRRPPVRSAPVVRVLGVEAAFTQRSYLPTERMALGIQADAPSLSLTFMRVGHGPDPSQRGDEMTGLPMAEPVTIDWTGQAFDASHDRRADGRVAHGALRGEARDRGRARGLRAVRASAHRAEQAARGRDPPDEYLAGVQPLRLRRRRLGRHLVRRWRTAGRPRPAVPGPRRPTALLPLRLPLPPLAREDTARAGRLRRRRPRDVRDRRRAARALRPRRLPRAQRVRDRARLRRRPTLSRPRRPADLPLGEQLLLEGRQAGQHPAARRPVAGARTSGGDALRRPVPRQRRRQEAGAFHRGGQGCGTLAVRGHRARERRHAWRGGRRLRHRDRHARARVASTDEDPGSNPGPVRPGAQRRDDVLRGREGRARLLRGRAGLPRDPAAPARNAAARQPVAPHDRGRAPEPPTT